MPSASRTFHHHQTRIKSHKSTFPARLGRTHLDVPGSNMNFIAKASSNHLDGPYSKIGGSALPRPYPGTSSNDELGHVKTVETCISGGRRQSPANDGIHLEYQVQQSWEQSHPTVDHCV
jgi:hypothetical protein